jgi:pseudaminic acid cytidylyltransferase
MVIGIIIARKGSKRIKNKNIRQLKNKPLYSWSIKTLKKSGLFKKIIVSTDHPSIIKNAESFGADIILKRKKELANSSATTIEVIKDTILEIEKKINFNYVCCMYPTSPLTTTDDIKRCFRISKNNKDKFVFPSYNSKINKIDKRQIENFYKINSIQEKNKILINKVYIDAGQFYFSSKKNWLNKRKIIDIGNIILIKNKSKIRDINTLNDLKYVRKIFNKKNEILQ